MKFFKQSFSSLLVLSLLATTCLLGVLPNPVYAADLNSAVKVSSQQYTAKTLGLSDKFTGGKKLPLPKGSLKNSPHNSNPYKKSQESINPFIKKPTKKNNQKFLLPQYPPQNNSNSNSNTTTQNITSTELSSYEQEAVNLLNADRTAQGLPALKVNMNLVRLAETYAADMIARGYFDHNNPEGLSPFDRMKNANITYQWAGENLAINSSVAAAQKALMASPGHRENILNPNFTQVGIGVKRHNNGSFYIVQEFIGL